MIGIAPTKVLFVIFLWERFFVPTPLTHMEKPTDLNRYREEKIALAKQAAEAAILRFLERNLIFNARIEWDESSNYSKLRCRLVEADTNEALLTGNQFHRDIIGALESNSDPRLEGYEFNPYGDEHYLTFDKN